jgi:hypothetical protein
MTKLKDIIKSAESGYDNLETAFEAVEEKAFA